MKHTVFFVLCFYFCLNTLLNAAVYKTVNVSADGLSTTLTATEKASITNLTVTGKIDARDVKFLRDSVANLVVLDISATNIQAYTGADGTVAISTSYPANEMPENSFSNMDYSKKVVLNSVILPNALASLGNYAFGNCSELTNITIPNTVTKIGDWTFCNCSRLTSITFPTIVTSIGDFAFYGCSGLTSMTIPNTVTKIGESAFSKCTGLSSISLSNTVTSINNGTFSDCTGLTGMTIPSSVTSIGDWTFLGCSKLKSIVIPYSVTSIGSGAFYNCTQISSISIPNSVVSIGEGAFCNCTAITKMTIPNSVTSIENSTFSNCSGLTDVTIPNAVTSIGNWVFYGCEGLTNVNIGDSTALIGEYAFCDCRALASIHANATTPATLTSSVFLAVNKGTCTLYVPADSEDAYQVATVWKEFYNIVKEEMNDTSIINPSKKELTIFPNPVAGDFRIIGLEGTGTLSLTDLSGKTIMQKQVNANDYISASFLSKGIYIARLDSESGFYETKMLKE